MMPAKGRKITRPQTPARRAGRRAAKNIKSWTHLRAYLPNLLLVAGCVLALGVAGVLYYAATLSSFFAARDITITGANKASVDEIRATVQRHAAQSGVWHTDLETLRTELNRLPWVSQATVSRVLPDGLRVHVQERTKVAVILPANGKPTWVDENGVKLGPYTTADRVPHLILLKGWNETETPEAAVENRERIQMYQSMLAEWDANNLSKLISDVDLANALNIRVALRSAPEVPIMLGNANWGFRLREALRVLEKERRNGVTYIDARLAEADNIIVGYAQPIAPANTSGDRARPATPPARAGNNARR